MFTYRLLPCVRVIGFGKGLIDQIPQDLAALAVRRAEYISSDLLQVPCGCGRVELRSDVYKLLLEGVHVRDAHGPDSISQDREGGSGYPFTMRRQVELAALGGNTAASFLPTASSYSALRWAILPVTPESSASDIAKRPRRGSIGIKDIGADADLLTRMARDGRMEDVVAWMSCVKDLDWIWAYASDTY